MVVPPIISCKRPSHTARLMAALCVEMNQQLREVIHLYIESYQSLFIQLAKDLVIELPITAQDWAILNIDQSGVSSSGIKYRKHGYGVVMRQDNLVVDFDFGKEGQLNGVDPWKLFYFAEENSVSLPYASVNELQVEFKSLVQNGEFIYSGYMLYYLADST